MKIHEYQAKKILKEFGIPVKANRLVSSVKDVSAALDTLEKALGKSKFVIKAQIHAGGRGKGGGVKLAQTREDAVAYAKKILGMTLVTPQTGPEGQRVKKIIIEAPADIQKEYYVAIMVNRSVAKNVILVSSEGGVEIENVAVKNPEKIIKEWIDPLTPDLSPYQARNLAYGLGFEGDAIKQAAQLFINLYRCFKHIDASVVEINPLILDTNGALFALDAKIEFDDAALFRHEDLKLLHDIDEENPFEVEAKQYKLNYIKLNGNVGCVVNGAGLAMATMDLIKLTGGEPANFLDVGGKANAETISKGFNIILKDPNVKAILVNIFGGIVRCDRVARGIIEAAKTANKQVPIVVRLQGTNAELANELLAQSDVEIIPVATLSEAAKRVVSATLETQNGDLN